jgi:hypothetical protein
MNLVKPTLGLPTRDEAELLSDRVAWVKACVVAVRDGLLDCAAHVADDLQERLLDVASRLRREAQ